jgi:hypothetical protein
MYLNEANKNLNKLISIINGNNNNNNYITTDKLFAYLKGRICKNNEHIYNNYEPITKTLICKFDLDSD